MGKQSKRELFPPLHSFEPCTQVSNKDGSLIPLPETIRYAIPVAVYFLLLAFCLLEASVERYVSILM
ncbi:hypothetical protein RUE5091_03451 [Ruegeria denitrificans]|uniref:Uncharacterized protein n=1 Tax=Ruegeria denitrificans TaxID=1715692 RepID=A0A0P1IGL4_9RHOB|nr:hypothetical protein RUE5091_03451 [Ruegeria denitrificans]